MEFVQHLVDGDGSGITVQWERKRCLCVMNLCETLNAVKSSVVHRGSDSEESENYASGFLCPGVTMPSTC